MFDEWVRVLDATVERHFGKDFVDAYEEAIKAGADLDDAIAWAEVKTGRRLVDRPKRG
jgi:hypothetical protein